MEKLLKNVRNEENSQLWWVWRPKCYWKECQLKHKIWQYDCKNGTLGRKNSWYGEKCWHTKIDGQKRQKCKNGEKLDFLTPILKVLAFWVKFRLSMQKIPPPKLTSFKFSVMTISLSFKFHKNPSCLKPPRTLLKNDDALLEFRRTWRLLTEAGVLGHIIDVLI